MSVTIETIQDLYPDAACIEQVDKKQMFTCYLDSRSVLLSYTTIVGYMLSVRTETGFKYVWHLTPNKHSRTTSKQLTIFAKGRAIHWCNDEEWETLSSN